MAKNKNNNLKNNATSSGKDSVSSTSKNAAGGSMKDTNKQFPDKRPSRSGPGGE
jgi:hypothetical protein